MPRRLLEQAKQYREWAARLRAEAASHKDKAASNSLIEMAQEWERLAIAAERDHGIVDKWHADDRRR